MLAFLPETEEGKGPEGEATWHKGSFLEAELAAEHYLGHFLAERLCFGYSSGFFPCWHGPLPVGWEQAAPQRGQSLVAAWAAFCGDSFGTISCGACVKQSVMGGMCVYPIVCVSINRPQSCHCHLLEEEGSSPAGQHGLQGVLFRITEPLRLDKTSEIIKSNRHPNNTLPVSRPLAAFAVRSPLSSLTQCTVAPVPLLEAEGRRSCCSFLQVFHDSLLEAQGRGCLPQWAQACWVWVTVVVGLPLAWGSWCCVLGAGSSPELGMHGAGAARSHAWGWEGKGGSS